jgi:hypothetical protein
MSGELMGVSGGVYKRQHNEANAERLSPYAVTINTL